MLIKRLYENEYNIINPNFIIRAWRTRNDLRDSGYEHYVRILGYDDYFVIDENSYNRIADWMERHDV